MLQLNKTYIGIVEDINDPLKIGRCRIRINFLFGEEIPTENLPWAYPAYSCVFGKNGQCGALSIPKVGSIIRVRFDNGNLYSPIYDSLQELGDDVKSFLQTNNYEGSQILLFDDSEKVRIYYTPGGGIQIQNDKSYINIQKDGLITIENKNSMSTVELDSGNITITSNNEVNIAANNEIYEQSNLIHVSGKTVKVGEFATTSAVCGEYLIMLLTMMASIIDMKMAPTPGVCTNLVEKLKGFILSDTVKIAP